MFNKQERFILNICFRPFVHSNMISFKSKYRRVKEIIKFLDKNHRVHTMKEILRYIQR